MRCTRPSFVSSFSGVAIASSYVAVEGGRDRSGASTVTADSAGGASSSAGSPSSANAGCGGAAGGGEAGGALAHAVSATPSTQIVHAEANLTPED